MSTQVNEQATVKAPAVKATKVKAAPKLKAFQMITGAAAIGKAIDSVGRRIKLIESDIHVAAVSCLDHADKHGDVTLMQRLVAALGKSQRRNALLDWAQAFGPFVWDDKNKTLVHVKGTKADVQGAIDTPFWELKPEPEYQPFDMAKELARLLTKAKNADKKHAGSVPEQVFSDLRKWKEYYDPTAAA